MLQGGEPLHETVISHLYLHRGSQRTCSTLKESTPPMSMTPGNFECDGSSFKTWGDVSVISPRFASPQKVTALTPLRRLNIEHEAASPRDACDCILFLAALCVHLFLLLFLQWPTL